MITSMRTVATLMLALAAPLSFAPAALAASAEAGAAKAAVCGACHGANGNSTNPEWPQLAGQNAAYITEQLHLFQKGVRVNPLMTAQASVLSEEDIADLAAYFAAQVPEGKEADPSYWKAGEKLYRAGDRARNVPACKACHGPVGRGNPGAAYPALRAQHSVYTVKQLTDYASEARYRDANGVVQKSRNGHIMVTIAHRLTADDIRDLASYIQGMR
jgi:cytochrome c553